MRPKLMKHFFRVIYPPSYIVTDIKIVLRFIIDSSFATRDWVSLVQFGYFLVRPLHSFEVSGVLLLVNVERIFFIAKACSEELCERVLNWRSVDYSHDFNNTYDNQSQQIKATNKAISCQEEAINSLFLGFSFMGSHDNGNESKEGQNKSENVLKIQMMKIKQQKDHFLRLQGLFCSVKQLNSYIVITIMQIRIQSSQKKRLISETSEVKQIEMKFLDKQSSKQFTQVRQQIMKTTLRKQSHLSFSRNRSSANNIHKDVNPKQFKTHISEKNFGEAQKEKEKQQEKSSKVEIKSQGKSIVVEQEQVKKIPYKFSYKSLAIELVVAYAATFAILYFIQLANFPYFQLILIIAFTVAIQPWRSSNLLMLIALGIVIGNYFLNLSLFTYPSIIICYYAVMVFNENYKQKQLFVLVLIFTIVFGFIIMPAIAMSLSNQGKSSIYPYIFPVLMLFLRTVVSCSYWFIDHTTIIFLQLPLFLTGLEYGAILSYDLQSIQFWYLLVAFSLQIVNDRTHFLLKILVSIVRNCSKQQKQAQKAKTTIKQYPVLPAHANGYACLHSFHLFALVYIYAELGLYTAPYAASSAISKYVSPGYKPVVVWLLSSVYQIMSIMLEKHKKNVLFFGFTSNKWWRSVLRGFVLSLGMWAFYLGLGLGVTKIFTTTSN